MRAELKDKNIKVLGVFPGAVDTDMLSEIDMPKTSPHELAENILAAIQKNQEDIFPDPMSQQMSEIWIKNPKELERQFASMQKILEKIFLKIMSVQFEYLRPLHNSNGFDIPRTEVEGKQ